MVGSVPYRILPRHLIAAGEDPDDLSVDDLSVKLLSDACATATVGKTAAPSAVPSPPPLPLPPPYYTLVIPVWETHMVPTYLP